MTPPMLAHAAAIRRPLHRAQVRRVGRVFLRMRPLLVAPAVLTSWVLLWPVAPLAQRVATMALSGSMLAFFAIEAAIVRRRELGETWLFRSLVITQLALLGASLGSGGTASPYVPLLFAPTVTAFAAFGRGTHTAIAFAILVTGMLGLAAVPADWPFPALPAATARVMVVLTVVLGAALLRVSVAGLSDAHEEAGRALDELRAEVLDGATARATEVERIGAKVAHEIRNPLTAIRGLVDLLAKDAGDERAVRRFEVVRGEIGRVETILRDYLSFARPLSELRRQPTALGSLVRRVADILDARAHAAQVMLTVDGADPVIDADPNRLTEALLNLVGNAIEASAAGTTVALALRDEGAHVAVVITDRGRGMSEALLARLGTAYVSEREGGTGLGVVLAQQVVQQHGGTLTFDSAPGRGTIATVTLPKSAPGAST